ncbi:uncharacterized protein LOC124639172 [Helicoverpa zea]|uniref:uncharacterized protein LOC124639172 n=1 Tax=Helicoverpa zea TaxID=7113 RepID=UPI001F5A33C3|nr:uncharacterized protein LOC124639172 [Helicoverpa zea]
MSGGRRRLLSVMQPREDAASEAEPQCIQVSYEENGATNVIRDCYYPPEEDDDSGSSNNQCKTLVGNNGNVTTCKVCTGDLCNASVKTTGTIGLLVACLVSTLNFCYRL